MTELTVEQLHHPTHTHRVFLGDSIGCLRLVQAPSHPLPPNYTGPPVKTVILPGFRSHSDHAVQKMAAGNLADNTWVIAMARKSGTIDVVEISDADASSSTHASAGVQANVIATIKEDRMKAGIERWVGLAVDASGIYSCTSAGSFRFTPIPSDSSHGLVGEPKLLDLPGPLQHLCFYPSANPTHFSYGGEEIPPSLWDISLALSEQPHSMIGDESAESIATDLASAAGMNVKMRKRKRQAEARAKSKEYSWGEVWRAKNLPNDYLSLPQRTNVAQVAIVDLQQPAAERREAALSPAPTGDANGAVPAQTMIVVGTKDGLIRVFEPASGSRKHAREHRILQMGQGAIKTMGLGLSAGELFVADTTGKLFSVDWRTGQTQYHYKDITGAITSLQPLPAPLSPTTSEPIGQPLLFSSSQDKLIRLHTTEPPPPLSVRPDASKPSAKSKVRGDTLWTGFSSPTSSSGDAPLTITTACVWDGKVPISLRVPKRRATKQRREGQGFDGVVDGEASESEEDEEGEEGDEVWSRMKEVGTRGEARGSGTEVERKGREDGSGENEGEGEEEEEDEEAHKEGRSKRTRK